MFSIPHTAACLTLNICERLQKILRPTPAKNNRAGNKFSFPPLMMMVSIFANWSVADFFIGRIYIYIDIVCP